MCSVLIISFTLSLFSTTQKIVMLKLIIFSIILSILSIPSLFIVVRLGVSKTIQNFFISCFRLHQKKYFGTFFNKHYAWDLLVTGTGTRTAWSISNVLTLSQSSRSAICNHVPIIPFFSHLQSIFCHLNHSDVCSWSQNWLQLCHHQPGFEIFYDVNSQHNVFCDHNF